VERRADSQDGHWDAYLRTGTIIDLVQSNEWNHQLGYYRPSEFGAVCAVKAAMSDEEKED